MNMKKNEIMYGEYSQEFLDSSIDDVVERVLDNNVTKAGESFDETADNIEWPIKVYVFKRMEMDAGWAKHIADVALETALESLDDTYGQIDEGYDASDKMKEAAKAFGEVMASDYVPWACEKTGEVIEVTRNKVNGR